MPFNLNNQNQVNKLIKYILFVFTGLISLLILLLLFTQTTMFRHIVKEQVVKIANRELNGKVDIDRLEGNFFSHLSIQGFYAGLNETDTLLAFDELSLQYSLWPLLNGQVHVGSIILRRPLVNISQDSDSTWNFQKLFPKRVADADTVSSEPLSLSFYLGTFRIDDGHFVIGTTDSIVPASINNFNLELNGHYSSRSMMLDLKHMGFLTPVGIPDLEHLQFIASKEDSVFTISDFALMTPQNRLKARGNYSATAKVDGAGEMETSPLELSEFSWILPDIRIGVSPEIELKTRLNSDNIDIDLKVKHQEQQFGLKGGITGFSNLLNDSLRHHSALNVVLSFQSFDPGKWFMLSDLPLVLNGNIQISGNGLENSGEPLKFDANFARSRWDQYYFRELMFAGSYLSGATKVQSRIATQVGLFDINLETHLSKRNAPFHLKIKADRFPAGHFLPEWGDSTMLNMNFSADGSGRDLNSLKARFGLVIERSVIAGIPVDSLTADGQIDRRSVILDMLYFRNRSADLSVSGRYTEEGLIYSEFEVFLANLDAFGHYVEVPVTWEELNLSGKAEGRPDSLLTDISINGQSLRYDTIAGFDNVYVRLEGLLKPDEYSGRAQTTLHGISASNVEMDSIYLTADVVPGEWQVETSAWLPDSLGLNLQATGNFQMPFQVSVPVMDVFTPYESFYLVGDGAQLFIDSTRMALSGFSLATRSNDAIFVRAEGAYIKGDSIDIGASVEKLDLSLIRKLGLVDKHMAGRLSAGVNVKGALSDPALDMVLVSDSIEAGQARLKRLEVNVSYIKDTLSAYLMIKSPAGDSLTAEGVSPVRIGFSDSIMVSSIKKISGRIHTRQLRPSSFFVFDDPDNQFFRALVDMDVTFDGSLLQPVLTGFVNASGGEISLPAYGIEYSGIKLRTRVDSNRIMVDSLFARRDKGTFLVTGSVAFDSGLVSGNLSRIDMSLKAKNFFVSRHPNHEIQINADTWFSMEEENPTYRGNLTVLRSSFYLPALLNMGAASDVNKPMLVNALEEEKRDSTYNIDLDSIRQKNPEGAGNQLMKNLTGKINVKIPRNSWIKSEDMNLELYGDFDLLKNNAYFEIFGVLGISRGYYTLYGRKLIVREGELTFQGGKDINPGINIKAEYIFRGKNKQKNELVMIAGGTAFEPQLSFTLNGNSITERDAMAYLLFNRSFDDLSFSNQEGVSGNLPSAMLSGLVSSQLTKTIGNTFDLDMVEIQAGDDWESATFMVGKYITNNLFVIYQRGFGESEDESLTPQKITLEYELTRNLSFRLTQGDVKDSGIDVILKFEKD